MQKVIETNIMLKQGCDITDHQSRVIEVTSWENYLAEIESGECVDRKASIGNLYGCSMPRNCKILDFTKDDLHASCSFTRYDGSVVKKLMYRIVE